MIPLTRTVHGTGHTGKDTPSVAPGAMLGGTRAVTVSGCAGAAGASTSARSRASSPF